MSVNIMRILIVNTAKRGGRAKFARELSIAIAGLGHDIEIIEAKDTQYSCLGVCKRFCAVDLHSIVGLSKTLFRLRRKIIAGEFDLVIYTSLHPILPILPRNLTSAKILYISHDPMVKWDKKMFDNSIIASILFRYIARSTERASDKIVLLNSSGFSFYRRMYSDEKVKLGFHPVFNSHAVQGNSSSKEYQIGFFGRISKYKGIEDFVSIAIEGEKRFDWKCVIAGEGELPNSRVSLLKKANIFNRWVSEIELLDLIDKTQVCILPYTSGSQSGIVSLCHSKGVPVVVPEIGGLPEQVTHGKTGIVLSNPSIEKYLAEAYRIIDSPDVIGNMKEHIQRQSSNQSWLKLAKTLLDE